MGRAAGRCAAKRQQETKVRKLRLLVLVALLGFAGAGAAQVDGKIGFVNLDRILRDAAPAQRAQKKIEGEFSKREQ